MSPELAYLLKVNVGIVLFYAFYRLFFYKDTFFQLRRALLLSLFSIAYLYPLFSIPEWVKGQGPITEAVVLYANALPEITGITTQDEAKPGWFDKKSQTLWYGYIGIALFLMIRFFIQLTSILHLAFFRCKKIELQGIPVYVPDEPAGPFSFFNLIFIHRESLASKEMEEVMAHEQTHVRQFHSVDVVISELLSIICWINPFVWLLKHEVRHNLEYLADNTVIQAGYDCKSYQYHLLDFVHRQGQNNLYNNFNVLHLKNRINMMNMKRSKNIRKTKYLFFIPLAGILMLFSNIEATARMTHSFAEKMTGISSEEKIDIQSKITPIEDDSVFIVVDKTAVFPGGEAAMYQFINKNLKYPLEAMKKGIKGRVTCSFTVNKEGKVSGVKVIKGVDTNLDAEAVRVISEMPNWTPAEKDGKKVGVNLLVPIVFRLVKESATPESTEKSSDDLAKVYSITEKQAEFPDGEGALYQFINKTMKYPVVAAENNIEGKVVCKFIINENGTISNAEVTQSIDESLDKEALRIIGLMPKWNPAEQKGKKVKSYYTLPFTFKMHKDPKAESKDSVK